MNLIADWTTAGPYRDVSWLTIIFTSVVIITLILASYELIQNVKIYNSVRHSNKNGALEVLSKNNVLKAIGRVGIQLCLLAIAIYAIIISIQLTKGNLYWYRIVFVFAFLITEFILWLLVLNDTITRKKLEELINKYYEGGR